MNFHYTTGDYLHYYASWIGMIANCANLGDAEMFYNFILFKACQEVLVDNKMVSVRNCGCEQVCRLDRMRFSL